MSFVLVHSRAAIPGSGPGCLDNTPSGSTLSSVAPVRTTFPHAPALILHATKDSVTHVTMKTLEEWYEYKGIYNEKVSYSGENISVVCNDLALFTSSYRFLTTSDLRKIGRGHGFSVSDSDGAKATVKNKLMEHSCSTRCAGFRATFVFRRLHRMRFVPPRSTVLPVHFVQFSNEHGPSEPGAVRTFNLNKFYKLVKSGTVAELELMGSGLEHKRLLCRTSNISGFVTHFLSLSVKELQSIAINHQLKPAHRKPNLINRTL